MINIEQFRQLIVKPVLKDLVLDSDSAEELLVFTCANESKGGTYLHQVNGPALGIYQMEPETYNDIWKNFINKSPRLCMILVSNFGCSYQAQPERMVWDLHFATVLARLHYARVSEPLPKANDLNSIWEYYKKYYNTPKGSAQKDSALENYHRFLSG